MTALHDLLARAADAANHTDAERAAALSAAARIATPDIGTWPAPPSGWAWQDDVLVRTGPSVVLTAMAAKTAVWIVSEPRPEHVAAITWLNEASSADFYMVKVEAVRIGESPAAPLLTVIVGPSEESKEIGRTKQELADRHYERKDWWAHLIALPEAKLHAHITPGQWNWISVSSGVRGLGLNYVITQTTSAAELFIDRGKDSEEANKRIFDQLAAHKGEIEAAFGGPLEWDRMDGRRASRIRSMGPGGYRSPEEEREQVQRALADRMNRLNAALQPFIKRLNLNG